MGSSLRRACGGAGALSGPVQEQNWEGMGDLAGARRVSVWSETELVEVAREGDERAFAELVERSRKRLFAVCVRITGNEDAALDASQTALLQAWRALPRFEGRSTFSTWLCQIGSHAAVAEVRRRRPEPVGTVPEPTGPFPVGVDDSVAAVRSVRWALAQLPPDFRAALVLREYADMTYREIAEAEGIRVETVKTRIARARQAMVALLVDQAAHGAAPAR